MRALRTVHLWLGIVVSLPLLAWSVSGLLAAWPQAVDAGGGWERIDAARVRVTPAAALQAVERREGRALPVTALTLQQRHGRAYYEAVGGLGAGSLQIDAESGAVLPTPEPSATTRFFRQAHFFWFAGRAQLPLLIGLSALSCTSVLTGLWLALGRRR